MRRAGLALPLLLPAVLAACAATPPAPCGAAGSGGAVYLVDHGWHVDIGVPAEALQGPLALFRQVFPGARTIMFGYGKRTFVTAPARSLSEWVLGPVPGPAVIQVVGLRVLPPEAYPDDPVVALALPPDGAARLSANIWQDLAKTPSGAPRLAAAGPFPGSLFYAAISGYSLLHTCNTWVAAALDAAGLPVAPDGVVFSGQVMQRAADTPGACQPELPSG